MLPAVVAVAVAVLGLACGTVAPAAESPLETVARFMESWNRHDFEAEMKCRSNAVTLVHDGKRSIESPEDREAERGYRAFDRVVRARFRYAVVSSTPDTVEIALTEDNDFLRAIGIPELRSRWSYVVREGRIQEEHHLNQPDPAYVTALRDFRVWVRAARPVESARVLDARGYVVFDGRTASEVLSLARNWEGLKRPR